jgi:hypothetical protein
MTVHLLNYLVTEPDLYLCYMAWQKQRFWNQTTEEELNQRKVKNVEQEVQEIRHLSGEDGQRPEELQGVVHLRDNMSSSEKEPTIDTVYGYS